MIVRAVDLDTGLIELREQPVDRYLQYVRELCDCYIGHLYSIPGGDQPFLLTHLEPVFPCLHDELAGFFCRQTIDIRQVIHGLLGEIFPRAHTTASQRERRSGSCPRAQQILGRHR